MSVTKDYIIDEIRRLARQNDGVSPGHLRFRTETGIKQADWRGKHWAKWSDALREAGCTPNEPTTAIPEEHLHGHYVQLVRDLGRLPTETELKLRRRSDPTFPSAEGFRGRLGPKRQIVKRLRDWCADQTGYDDIIELCDAYIPPPRATSSHRSQEGIDAEWGSVYLMKSGKYFKIGRSNSPGRREYELAIQLPERLETIHVISTDDPAGIEAYWHHRFKQKRKGGEWFDLAPADVAAFKRRRFQ